MLAVDFFTAETFGRQRLYVLFFIELAIRRVHVSGCTRHPNRAWVTQQARQFAWTFPERIEPPRFLIRDREEVHGRVRRGLSQRQAGGGTHAETSANGERRGGTLRSDRSGRVSGLLLIASGQHLQRVSAARVHRRDRLGGLIHEYSLRA